MRGLPTLIRLTHRRADEQRVALAEAERQSALARKELALHEQAYQAEKDRARGDASEMASWSEWSRFHTRQRQPLRHAIALLQRQEEALRDTFAEIKRLEIALDTANQQAQRIARRKAEQAAEDAELRRYARR